MFDFDIHNKDTASKEGAKSIDEVLKKFGFIPNIIGVMAEAPATAASYLALADLAETTSFSDTEIQTVLMTINRFHECTYCMAAHSVIAGIKNVPESVINAIRDDLPIQDNKLETLRQTAYSLVENRGHLSEGTLGKFAAAGYTRKNLLELLPLIAMKTISNYTNHLANTPLDDAFHKKSGQFHIQHCKWVRNARLIGLLAGQPRDLIKAYAWLSLAAGLAPQEERLPLIEDACEPYTINNGPERSIRLLDNILTEDERREAQLAAKAIWDKYG